MAARDHQRDVTLSTTLNTCCARAASNYIRENIDQFSLMRTGDSLLIKIVDRPIMNEPDHVSHVSSLWGAALGAGRIPQPSPAVPMMPLVPHVPLTPLVPPRFPREHFVMNGYLRDLMRGYDQTPVSPSASGGASRRPELMVYHGSTDRLSVYLLWAVCV